MIYYFTCFVITWILTAAYFLKWKNSYSIYITLSFIAVAIMNFGYWQLSMAKSVREAIISQCCAYSGGSFVAMLLLFSIFDICKLHIKKIYRFAFFILCLVIYASSLTIGHFPIFYKSVTLAEHAGATVIIKEYGPMHTVYYLSVGIYFLAAIVALLYAIKNKSEISKKNAFLFLICFFVGIVSFAVGRFLGTVDLFTAFANMILFTYILFLDRFVMYDVDTTAIQTLQRSNYVGIVSFDLRHRFLGCNRAAKEYFPELRLLNIDRTTNEPIFLGWISELEKNKELKKTISRENRFYSLEGHYLMDGKTIRGLQFILQDCTNEVEYQEYLKNVAVTDDMTHLLNRRAFEDEVKAMSEQKLSDDLVMISFDLNGLKSVNDTIGHYAGDELICAAADKINEAVSSFGKVFRIGGDEFAAIAYCNREKLAEILEFLQQKCSDWRGKYSEQLSISKGYAFHSDNPNLDVYGLVREADKQMYSDKSLYYRVSGHDRRRRE